MKLNENFHKTKTGNIKKNPTTFVYYVWGNKKPFGVYKTKKEADTAIGLHKMELENSGYDKDIKWNIKKTKV